MNGDVVLACYKCHKNVSGILKCVYCKDNRPKTILIRKDTLMRLGANTINCGCCGKELLPDPDEMRCEHDE